MSTAEITIPVAEPGVQAGAGIAAGRFAARGRRRLERIDSRVIAATGSFALVGLVAGSFLIVAVAAARSSFLSPPSHAEFPGWMSGPLHGLLSGYRPSAATLSYGFTFTVGGMYALYLVALACARRVRAGWAIAAIGASHAIFFLSPPLPLTDVFNYINYGRMGVVHGLNPYASIPALEPYTDPSFVISNWHHLLSPYGPLFTLFSYAIVPLGVHASFWVLKGTFVLASLATLWLIWRCAQLLGRDPLRAVMFVGLNPLVLVWGLGGAHNDFLMVFFIVLALYLLLSARARGSSDGLATEPIDASAADADCAGRGRREFSAGLALAAAVAIKASAGILLPVLLIGSRRRLRLSAGIVVGFVVLGAATVAAFGLHLPDVAEQNKLVTSSGLVNLFGLALGQGGETDAMRGVLDGALALAVAGACVLAWRQRDWLPAVGVAMVALLVSLSSTLPWYVLWLLPLAALARSRSLRVIAVAFGVYLILAWVPVAVYRPGPTPLSKTNMRLTRHLLF